MDLRTVGMAAALGSAASWAVGSILFKRLGERINSLAMTLFKGSLSVLLLGIVLLFTQYQPIDLQPLLLLLLSGLLGISLGDTFFFEALQDLGPHALVLLLMLGQVVTAVLAVVFLGEQPSLTVWSGIGLVIVGIGMVLWTKLGGDQFKAGLRGVMFGLLAVACMSISIVIAKLGLEDVSAIQATFLRMLAGTLGMLCFGLGTRRLSRWVLPFKELNLMALFFVSVCIVTFGGFWLSLVAIKYVDVAIANTLNSTEPLFVLPLAIIFLKEKVSFSAIIGTLIAVAGIVLLIQG